MIEFFKTSEDGKITEIETAEKGCWINVIAPSEDEMTRLVQEFNIDEGFLKSSVDDEETSHIEAEDDGQTLVIIDMPITLKGDMGNFAYQTFPMGIITTHDYVLTVALRENAVVKDFSDGIVKNLVTSQKTGFLLHILLRMASKYLQNLRQIDKMSNYVEKQLYKSMKNKELLQLLDLQKSLVFFSTSLKANEVTLEKILRGRTIKLYDEDQDLLEDVIIEVKQAIEMSNIYLSILSGTMDAFASIISNNLNVVMRVLTSITVLIALPTMIFSYYGMNMGDSNLPFSSWWIVLIFAVVVTGISAFILKKGKFL